VWILEIEIKLPRHELVATCEQSHEGYEQLPYDASQTGSYGSQDNALGSPAIDQCGQGYVQRSLVDATGADQRQSADAHATPVTVSHQDE
jgi:hypothetical protein